MTEIFEICDLLQDCFSRNRIDNVHLSQIRRHKHSLIPDYGIPVESAAGKKCERIRTFFQIFDAGIRNILTENQVMPPEKAFDPGSPVSLRLRLLLQNFSDNSFKVFLKR